MDYYDLYDDSIIVKEYSIEETREDLDKLVEYFRDTEISKTGVEEAFVKERQLPLSIAEQQKVFFIPEDINVDSLPEWMHESSLGFISAWGRVYQGGRLIYPVMDIKGHTMGLCGWDMFVSPKYLDSKNFGYKAKWSTLYGMEKLPEYYLTNKTVFVTEGIVCCLYLRSLGYQALALLGSHITPYVKAILNRFGSRLTIIPDNDEAGDSLVKQCKFDLKKCVIVQVKIGKDIDGCRKLEDHRYEDLLKYDLSTLNNPFCSLSMFIRR